MRDDMESVKIRSATMGIIREWAEASGITVSGLASDLLDEAGSHYMDGTLAGRPKPAAQIAVHCPQCGTLAFPVFGRRGFPTGEYLCDKTGCPQMKVFWPQPKLSLMDAPNGFDADVSFPEDEHVGQRGWNQE